MISLIIPTYIYSQSVDCFILEAPEKPFYDMKKIGVLKFNVTNNSRKEVVLTDFVVADLLSQKRGIYNPEGALLGLLKSKEGQTFVKGVNTDFYDVIERDQLEKIIKEQRLGLSGALDESSAAEVGKLAGLDVIILGNASYTSNEERSTSTDSHCLTRKVTVKGTMKIISVETAQVEGTKTASYEVQDRACNDKISGMMTVEQLADLGLKQLARGFVNYFTPGYAYMKYKMEKIKIKELKDDSKEAVKFLQNGDIDRAFPIVYAMYEADSYNPKAAYNLGAVYEMVGSYTEALEYYGIAYELDYTNTKYQEGRDRAKSGIALSNYLADLGRPIQPYSFMQSGQAGALADRVQIKGSSSERIPVYELADKGSGVVAQVPGGLEFKVLETQDEYYKIQLMGNKSGFVHKSNIK